MSGKIWKKTLAKALIVPMLFSINVPVVAETTTPQESIYLNQTEQLSRSTQPGADIEEQTQPIVVHEALEENNKWSPKSDGKCSLVEEAERGTIIQLVQSKAADEAVDDIGSTYIKSDLKPTYTTPAAIRIGFDFKMEPVEGADFKTGIKLLEKIEGTNKEVSRLKIEYTDGGYAIKQSKDGGYETLEQNELFLDGEWNNIQMIQHMSEEDNQSVGVDIYLNYEKLNNEPIISPNPAKQFTQIQVFSDSKSQGTLYVDAISIAEFPVGQEPVIEEEDEDEGVVPGNTLEETGNWQLASGTELIEDGHFASTPILKMEAGTSSTSNKLYFDNVYSTTEDEMTIHYKMLTVDNETLKGGIKLYPDEVKSEYEAMRFKLDNGNFKQVTTATIGDTGKLESVGYTTIHEDVVNWAWHDVVIIYTKQAGAMVNDVYLNGTKINAAPLTNPKNPETIDAVSFFTDSNTVGNFYIDDLTITAGRIEPAGPMEPEIVTPPEEPVDPNIETPKPEMPADLPELQAPVSYPGNNVYGSGLNGHSIREPEAVIKTINVTEHGVISDDGKDDTATVRAILEDADYGTELYFPDGTYEFITNDSTILALEDGVSLRGQSQDKTILKAIITDDTVATTFMAGVGVTNLSISDLTLTSKFYGKYPDPVDKSALSVNPKQQGNMTYGINLNYNMGTGQPSEEIEIENVTIENFSKMAIGLRNTQDIRVKGCTFQYATDIGGGGAGYGVSIQGMKDKDDLGKSYDSKHNIVEECKFIGPYIRHGVLLQYWTHNNLVINNMLYGTGYGSIDLHGEDEYLNEIAHNAVYNCRWGGGIEVGNSGAGHDLAGPLNYIHNNTLEDGLRGIDIVFGTPDTIIEHNTVKNVEASGIMLLNSERTIVRDNTIEGNGKGIYLDYEDGYEWQGNPNWGEGIPVQSDIYDNQVSGNTENYVIEDGKDNTLYGAGVVDGDKVVDKSTNPQLVAVVAEGTQLTRPFIPTQLSYYVYTNQSTFKFTAYTSAKDVASMMVDGKPVRSGEQVAVELEEGANQINIDVVAQDGLAKQTYTLHVTKLADGETIPTPVQSVSLKGTPPSIPLGKTYTLEAVVGPEEASNKAVEWKILDGEEFVSIAADGKVTPLGVGEAEVKLSSVQNPEVYITFTIKILDEIPGQPDLDPEAVNLAIESVSASHSDTGKAPENAIDGDYQTPWAGATGTDGTPVEFIIKLAEPKVLTHVDIAWFKGSERKANFTLSTSADGKIWDEVEDFTSSGVTELAESYLTPTSYKAQYVKFEGHGNVSNAGKTSVWNSFYEIQVYGKDGEPHVPQTYTVKDAQELDKAVTKVLAGDTIILKDGVYTDVVVDIKASGTATNPIVIKAENAGKAVFEGVTEITLSGKHISLESVVFENGEPLTDLGCVIIAGDYCRFTNSRISSFNGTDKKWVSVGYKTDTEVVSPQYVEIDHNLFEGKDTIGALITIWRENDEANYVYIHDNHFRDYTNGVGASNGLETIRIGTSDHSQSDSYTIVENNLFERITSEIEMISIKSGRNVVRGNTVIDSTGSITSRHGKNNLVEGNIILGNDVKDSGGIRAYDRGHIIRNNYVQGVNTTSNSRSSILIHSGNNVVGTENLSLNAQWTANNITVENNTIYESKQSFSYGEKYDVVPEAIDFSGNVVYTTKGEVIREAEGKQLKNGTYTDELYYSSVGLGLVADETPGGITFTQDAEAIKLVENTDGLFLHATNGAQDLNLLVDKEVGPQSQVTQKATLTKETFDVAFEDWKYDNLPPETAPEIPEDQEIVVIDVENDKVSVVVDETKYMPTDDTYVDIEAKTNQYSTSEILRVKTNVKKDKGRIAYLRFDIDPEAIETKEAITFTLSVRISPTSNPEYLEMPINVFLLDDFENWQESKLNWMNSPNHEVKTVVYSEEHIEATQVEGITVKGGHETIGTYTIDITEAVKDTDGTFTLMLIEPEGKNYNTDPYSQNKKDEQYRPFIEMTGEVDPPVDPPVDPDPDDDDDDNNHSGTNAGGTGTTTKPLEVTSKDIADAIDVALKEGNKTVVLDAGNHDVVSLPSTIFQTLKDGEEKGVKEIQIKGENIAITLPEDLVAVEVENKVHAQMQEVKTSDLTTEQQKVTNGQPVYEIGIAVDEKLVEVFDKPMHISVTHDLESKHNPSYLTVFKILPDGTVENVGGVYEDGKMQATVEGSGQFFVAENKVEFNDLKPNTKYYDSIMMLAAKGYVAGIGEDKFAPEKEMTRAEFTTLLANVIKLKPSTEGKHFADVAEDAWYADTLNACVDAGLIYGVSEDTFAPEAVISAQDMLIIMMRALDYMEIEVTDTVTDKEVNYDGVDAYAKDAIERIIQTGVITEPEAFSAKETVQRGYMASVLEQVIYKIH